MHVPVCAVGLWNAACNFVFIGAVAGFVWQSVQASFAVLFGFSGFDAWWHCSHLKPVECFLWSNFTAPLGAFSVYTSCAFFSSAASTTPAATIRNMTARTTARYFFTLPPLSFTTV